jgi:hypothetical protein
MVRLCGSRTWQGFAGNCWNRLPSAMLSLADMIKIRCARRSPVPGHVEIQRARQPVDRMWLFPRSRCGRAGCRCRTRPDRAVSCRDPVRPATAAGRPVFRVVPQSSAPAAFRWHSMRGCRIGRAAASPLFPPNTPRNAPLLECPCFQDSPRPRQCQDFCSALRSLVSRLG